MNYLRKDFFSSSVLFFVAIPLSLGIALASGVSPAAGLISAIIGGIVVGLLSGAPLVVSGPAAGLTILVYQIVQSHGLKGLAVITVMAGLFQLLFAVLRLGWVFEYVSKSVLEGMLAAIGVLIIASQVHILMGSTPPGGFSAQVSGAIMKLKLSGTSEGANLTALALGISGIAIQALWPKLPAKVNWIPAAIPTVFILTLAAVWIHVPFVSIGDLTSSLNSSLEMWTGPLTAIVNMPTLLAALGVAVVASAETLLTARALDGLCERVRPGTNPPSNLNRELLAQGIGNTLAGAIGGIPMTGVIVRSAVNVNAGAMTRKSTVFHGIWVLVFALFMPQVLGLVPLTALASILVFTGVKLLDPIHRIRSLAKPTTQDGIWWLTLFAILFTDLLSGLGIGVFASFFIEWMTSGYKPQVALARMKGAQ